MSASDRGFSLLILDFFGLYNRAVDRLDADPAWVSATCRRSLAVLRAYSPKDLGQEILIETAIAQFLELAARATTRRPFGP